MAQSTSLIAGSPILDGVATAYPASGSAQYSPQYLFVLNAINSSPTLLQQISNAPVVINIVNQNIGQYSASTNTISIGKSWIDTFYNYNQAPPSDTPSYGADQVVALLAHEFSHAENSANVIKTNNDLFAGLSNSGLSGVDAQNFVDTIVRNHTNDEGRSQIQEWNALISAGRSTGDIEKENQLLFQRLIGDPNQSIPSAHLKPNADGTISLTDENLNASGSVYSMLSPSGAGNADYKNYYGAFALTNLALRGQPGDVINLSGYDPQKLLAGGFKGDITFTDPAHPEQSVNISTSDNGDARTGKVNTITIDDHACTTDTKNYTIDKNTGVTTANSERIEIVRPIEGGGQRVDVKNLDSNGTLKDETVTTTSADGRTVDIVLDTDGDGRSNQTKTTAIDTTGTRTDTIKDYSPDGSLKEENITTTSADGSIMHNWTREDGTSGVDQTDASGSSYKYRADADGNTTYEYVCADGSYGSSIHFSDGSGNGVNYGADGSITENFDYADGSNSSSYRNVDGSYGSEAEDSEGNYRSEDVDANGTINRAYQNIDGSYGSSIDDRMGNMQSEDVEANGSITSNWTRSDGSSSSEKDFDGDGSVDRTETVAIDTDNKTTYSVRDYLSDGSLQNETVTITSADGNTVSIVRDTNGDGSVDRREVVTEDQVGRIVDHVWDYDMDANLTYEEISTTSTDGNTIDFVRDTNGDGFYDQFESVVEEDDGDRFEHVWDYESDGSLIDETFTIIRDDGTMDVVRDTDGDGDVDENEYIKMEWTPDENDDEPEEDEPEEDTESDPVTQHINVIDRSMRFEDVGSGPTIRYMRDFNNDQIIDQIEYVTTLGNGAQIDDIRNYEYQGTGLNVERVLKDRVLIHTEDEGKIVDTLRDFDGDGLRDQQEYVRNDPTLVYNNPAGYLYHSIENYDANGAIGQWTLNDGSHGEREMRVDGYLHSVAYGATNGYGSYEEKTINPDGSYRTYESFTEEPMAGSRTTWQNGAGDSGGLIVTGNFGNYSQDWYVESDGTTHSDTTFEDGNREILVNDYEGNYSTTKISTDGANSFDWHKSDETSGGHVVNADGSFYDYLTEIDGTYHVEYSNGRHYLVTQRDGFYHKEVFDPARSYSLVENIYADGSKTKHISDHGVENDWSTDADGTYRWELSRPDGYHELEIWQVGSYHQEVSDPAHGYSRVEDRYVGGSGTMYSVDNGVIHYSILDSGGLWIQIY